MNHRSLLFLAVGILYLCLAATAQNSVGIGTETPNSNAVLHLVSPDGDQGFLVPQLTTVQRTATTFTDNLAATDAGLLVFDTDEVAFFYWSGSDWSTISPQQLTAGTGLSITDGVIANSGDLDATNEIQDLSLTGNSLTVTNNSSATTIDLTPYLDNTDDQTATEVPVTASGNLTSTNVQDALSELQGDVDNINLTGGDNQTLSLSGSTLSITGGNSADLSSLIDDADADATNEIQDLSFDRDILAISGSESTVDLSGYLDNTDAQTLSFDGTNLALTGGGSVDLSSLADGTGTDNQTLTLATDILTISGSGSNVDLSGYLDNTDAQTLSFDGTNLALTGGGSVDLSSLADGTGTDNQTLSLATDILTISGSGSNVDLSGYLDNTDAQSISLTTNTLSISGNVSTVDLSGYLDNTDEQDLSLTGNILSLTGDASTVSLAAYLDNTDDQTATEVPVTAGNGMTSTNAQAALAEHQTDINSHTSSISSLGTRVSALEDAKQDYLFLTATDFLPLYSVNGNDARYTENEVYIMAGEASAVGQLKAMVELPDGATIKAVEGFGANDATNTTVDATITLYAVAYGDNKLTATSLGADKISAKAGTFVPFAFNPDALVDNSARLYYIIFQGQGGVSSPYASLNYIRITYTY